MGEQIFTDSAMKAMARDIVIAEMIGKRGLDVQNRMPRRLMGKVDFVSEGKGMQVILEFETEGQAKLMLEGLKQVFEKDGRKGKWEEVQEWDDDLMIMQFTPQN